MRNESDEEVGCFVLSYSGRLPSVLAAPVLVIGTWPW